MASRRAPIQEACLRPRSFQPAPLPFVAYAGELSRRTSRGSWSSPTVHRLRLLANDRIHAVRVSSAPPCHGRPVEASPHWPGKVEEDLAFWFIRSSALL